MIDLGGIPDARTVCEGWLLLAVHEMNHDRLEAALHHARVARDMADRIELPRTSARARLYGGIVLKRLGRPGESRDWLEDVVARTMARGERLSSMSAMLVLGHLHLELQDHEGARRWLEDVAPLVDTSHDPAAVIDHRALTMRLDWLTGDRTSALAAFEDLLKTCRHASRSSFNLYTYFSLTEVAIAATSGNPLEHRSRGQQALTILDRELSRWRTKRPYFHWYAARFQGASGNHREATRHFAKGAVLAARVGNLHMQQLCENRSSTFFPVRPDLDS
jgi:tetratricopeptide (TPR) repeat protein